MKATIAVLVLTGALAANVADAATLDFQSLGFGNQGTSVLVLANATVTSAEGDLFVGAGSIPNSVCALSTNPLVGTCESDIDIVFNSLVSNLTLQTGGFNPGDSVSFFAYDNSAVLLGSVLGVSSNTTVDLTAFAGIRRLFIDDSSTGAGFSYGNFDFTSAPTAVPEPATLLLFGSGLAASAYRRRKSVRK